MTRKLATFGSISFVIGIALFGLTFISGFGPCGPSTRLGGFLISIGFLTVAAGALMMVAAFLRAALGRK
jgi:hypothetical protein